MKFSRRNCVEYVMASRSPRVLVDAVHAANPGGDSFTGRIAMRVAEHTGCHCIIGVISRRLADLNRPPNNANMAAIKEYRSVIHEMLQESHLLSATGRLDRPFLHLAIHGMKDRTDRDVELGTLHGASCDREVIDWIESRFRIWLRSFPDKSHSLIVSRNGVFCGDRSKAFHRVGDPATGYQRYGDCFNTVQVEFAHWLRRNQQNSVVQILGDIVREFAQQVPNRNCA